MYIYIYIYIYIHIHIYKNRAANNSRLPVITGHFSVSPAICLQINVV